MDETEKKAVQFAFAGILFSAGMDAIYRTLTMPYAQEGPLFFDIQDFERKLEIATTGLGYRDMRVRPTPTAPRDPHTKAEIISSTNADELREYVRTHHMYDFLFTDFTSYLPTALINAFRSKPYLTELLLPYPYQRRKPEDRTIQELFHERAVILVDAEENPTTPTPLDDEGLNQDESTPLPPWMNDLRF